MHNLLYSGIYYMDTQQPDKVLSCHPISYKNHEKCHKLVSIIPYIYQGVWYLLKHHHFQERLCLLPELTIPETITTNHIKMLILLLTFRKYYTIIQVVFLGKSPIFSASFPQSHKSKLVKQYHTLHS